MGQGTMVLFKDFVRQMGGVSGHEFNGGEDYILKLITNAVVATEDDVQPAAGDYTECAGGGYVEIKIAADDWDYLDGVAYFVGDDPTWPQDGAGPTDCYQCIMYLDDSPDPVVLFIDLTADGGVTPLSLQDGPIGLVWGGLTLPGKIFKCERGVAA